MHKGLVRSDHLAVTVSPLVPAKPSGKFVSFRDPRDHCKIVMDRKLELCNWTDIIDLDDPEECVRALNDRLWKMFDESFSLIRVKVSSRDPPFMSPLVKHLCNIRNKSSRTGNVAENIMRQERINSLIRWNQVCQ